MMTKGKDTRNKEQVSRDSSFESMNFEYGNRLSLPEALKQHLIEKNLDWRFLNAEEYRKGGNYHRSMWQPFSVKDTPQFSGMATTAEGLIQRGDLILGVRQKAISAKHREFLDNRNKAYSMFNKTEAQKMRQHIKDTGLSQHVKVDEGYGEDDGSED